MNIIKLTDNNNKDIYLNTDLIVCMTEEEYERVLRINGLVQTNKIEYTNITIVGNTTIKVKNKIAEILKEIKYEHRKK